MSTPILRPVYLIEELGELGRLPDGSIINVGGVVGPNFTVGGRGLLFDDGSSTSAGSGTGFTLQVAYGNSAVPAQIDLTMGKNIVFNAINQKKFIFDAGTGTVTIEGDLNVLGLSNVIEGTVSNLDQVNILPPVGNVPALTIEPMVGITPTANLVEIKAVNGGLNVFSVLPSGTTQVTNLIIDGTLNGTAVQTIVDHLNASTSPAKHTADQISFVDTGLANVHGSDVQTALASIDSKLSTIGVGNVTGFEYVQITPADTWTINHNVGSRRIQSTVWDEAYEAIFPDQILSVDNNTVTIRFSSPQAGRAILMIF